MPLLSQESTVQKVLLSGGKNSSQFNSHHCDVEKWANFKVFRMSLFSDIHLIAYKLPTLSSMISSVMPEHSSS